MIRTEIYYRNLMRSCILHELPSGCIAISKGYVLRKPFITFQNCTIDEMNFITNQININERYYNPKIRNLGLDIKESIPFVQTSAAIGSLALTTLL